MCFQYFLFFLKLLFARPHLLCWYFYRAKIKFLSIHPSIHPSICPIKASIHQNRKITAAKFFVPSQEIFTLLISKTRNIKNEILLIITMPSLTKISGTSLTLLALLISKFVFTNTREKTAGIKCFADFTFLYRTKKMIAFMTFFF